MSRQSRTAERAMNIDAVVVLEHVGKQYGAGPQAIPRSSTSACACGAVSRLDHGTDGCGKSVVELHRRA
jgi:hypothetical protein